MAIQRMEHVGIVVDDLAAATEFFVELGLELQGEGSVEGRWVDRIVGLEGVRTEFAFMQTPDGHGRLELIGPGRGGGLSAAPFPRPASEPDVRLSAHPALHESCGGVGFWGSRGRGSV